MPEITTKSFAELIRAGALLSRELNFKSLVSGLVDQSIDISKSDLACLYLYLKHGQTKSNLNLIYKRGKFRAPEGLSPKTEFLEFIKDCGETVLLLERKESPFIDLLLNSQMRSGIALPLSTPTANLGVLILNSLNPDFYNREQFYFLDSFTKLAGGMLHNSRLYQELKDYLREIEELKRYQENIFSSMTNLLVTTDKEGKIKYFNTAAEERFGLSEQDLGHKLREVFVGSIGRQILDTIDSTTTDPKELLGIEGIFQTGEKELDFALNVSPLKGKRGQHQGVTMLFTDQTRERELQERMERVVEERRIIKNMFARYLSKEIVKRLTESPKLVRLGGDKKEATIFFADIRGYTSFSEGKDPEYIIKILNEYFSEAVELVIKHKGYIDKYIGDCIMAAWGVPLQTAKEDVIQAVSCALQIQRLVASEQRKFFRGEASNLKVGIGMHTGPLVAGNLGSSRRMNYTVIGDTVNVAARLEGVAGPGEVIITERTRDYLEDSFIVQEKKPIKVKGKLEPIKIYNVIGRNF